MNDSDLLTSFQRDPLVQKLMGEGDLEKVARMATSVGTTNSSPELRKYGRELWEASQKVFP